MDPTFSALIRISITGLCVSADAKCRSDISVMLYAPLCGSEWDYYLRIENAERLCFDRRVFIYLFICMRVIRRTQKVLN